MGEYKNRESRQRSKELDVGDRGVVRAVMVCSVRMTFSYFQDAHPRSICQPQFENAMTTAATTEAVMATHPGTRSSQGEMLKLVAAF